MNIRYNIVHKNIVYKRYRTEDELIEAADIALENRLYVNNWYLRSRYINIKRGDIKNQYLDIAFIDDKPIGICFAKDSSSDKFKEARFLACFIRKPFRKIGIGSKLISLHNNDKKELYACTGIDGSKLFWTKNKVNVTSFSDSYELRRA